MPDSNAHLESATSFARLRPHLQVLVAGVQESLAQEEQG